MGGFTGKVSGYNTQNHAENAFSRYKRTFGGRLRAKWRRLSSYRRVIPISDLTLA